MGIFKYISAILFVMVLLPVVFADYELSQGDTKYIFSCDGIPGNLFLKTIKVNDVQVYTGISDNGNPGIASIWKVIFMKHQKEQPYRVWSYELTSTQGYLASCSSGASYIAPYWICTDQLNEIEVRVTCTFSVNYRYPNDSLYCEITVDNRTPDTEQYEYRLMEVHFPFMLLGPSSFVYVPPNPFPPEPTPTPFPPVPPGDDYLTFPSYLLKNPSDNMLPELPEYVYSGDNKMLWEGNYSGTLFHYYYPVGSNESRNPGYYGLYLAAYNTYGHPCQINFAKNNDPDYTSDSFYYDLLMYPRGDIISTQGNDFSMPSGFLIEIRPLKGDWFTASQHYLSVTDSLRNYTPPPGSPAPAYSATPIWNTTSMVDNNRIPNWLKKTAFLYYISPQVSDTYFFVPPFQVKDRAMQFKNYMFDTGQPPAVATPLTEMDQFLVMTWHSNLYGPQSHPYYFPEWAGGNMPIHSPADWNFYRGHSQMMIDQIHEASGDELRVLFNPGGALYHFDGTPSPTTPTSTPGPADHPAYGYRMQPDPPGEQYLSYGMEYNGDWGFKKQYYQGSIPSKKTNAVGGCPENPNNKNFIWGPQPEGILPSIFDDDTLGLHPDALYTGHTIQLCLGDYTDESQHGHPRGGDNYSFASHQKLIRDFHARYNNGKPVVSETQFESMMADMDAFAAQLYPPPGIGVLDMDVSTGLNAKPFYKYSLTRNASDLVVPIPMVPAILHDKVPFFDGMGGWITGVQFHPEYQQTQQKGWRYAFYTEAEPGVDPTVLPLRSLNADLAYTYIYGCRFGILDVDMPVNSLGTPLPTPNVTTPVSTPGTPVPPVSARNFLDEPYVIAAKNYLKTMIASYVYEGTSPNDRVYKTLLMGKMLRPVKIASILWPIQTKFNYKSGNLDPYWPELEYEFNSPGILTSTWRSPSSPEFVVLSFTNFSETTQSATTFPTDVRQWFTDPEPSPAPVYYQVPYHLPSSAYQTQVIPKPEQAVFSVTLFPRSVANIKVYRVFPMKDASFHPGVYANCNADEYPDCIACTDGELVFYPGTDGGTESKPVFLSDGVEWFEGMELNLDSMTDFVCFAEERGYLLLSQGDGKYTVSETGFETRGRPVAVHAQDPVHESAGVLVVYQDGIDRLKIHFDQLSTEIEAWILDEGIIQNAIFGYLDTNEIIDCVIQVSSDKILFTENDTEGWSVKGKARIDSGYQLDSVKDYDLDSDLDIKLVQMSDGKKESEGTEESYYLKNEGDWDFE